MEWKMGNEMIKKGRCLQEWWRFWFGMNGLRHHSYFIHNGIEILNTGKHP